MDFSDDLDKIAKISQFLEHVENQTMFGNWSLTKVLIHLWTWDEELIRLIYAQVDDEVKAVEFNKLSPEDRENLDGFFQFEYQQLGISEVEWNELMFERYKNYQASHLLVNFRLGRKRLIRAYKDQIAKFSDLPDITKQTIELWKHDLVHIKSGGFTEQQILYETSM